MLHYGIMQNQHCNDGNDNVMRAIVVWILWWIILMSKPVIYWRECDNKGDLN